MSYFEGKCAIVTGAAYGIGFAIARRLAEAGAAVVVSDIKGHEEAAAKLSAEGLNAVALHADVASDESVDALVAAVMDRLGRIDIVVNNAAISSQLQPGPFESFTSADWLRVYDVNVVGVVRMCRAVSPVMRVAGGGRIVNMSSGTAFKGAPGLLHYVASKGAIISLTRSLATEFGKDNVIVNAVAPGMTLTESTQGSPEFMKVFEERAIGTRVLKRHAYSEDVAGVAFFLAGPDAGFVTGQVIAADGGCVFH